ncbi:MAG: hypothetical protein A2Y23_14715 [Clostridiales bacterium GWB2_37_7]|nr:MAG: hypothetical protein A2Y23_14715 [Clostridiales bacterium GWB2_37_7]
MKNHVFFHRVLILIVSVSMILSLTSCAPQKKPVPQTSKSQEEQNKPPKELDELSKAVEKTEKALYEMHERSKLPLFIQQEEIKKQEEKQKKEQGGQEQQNDQESGQGKQSSQVELVTPQAKQVEPQLEIKQMKIEIERANLTQIEQLKKDVIELHGLWNAFEAKAVSQFVMQSSIEDFEDALNNLTKSLDSNNVFQGLLDVTQLYKYLPDFYLTYSSDYPPEIDKIRFAIKKTQLLGEKKNYPAAKEAVDYLTGIWMLTRPKLNKDSIDMINQIEFALSDLNKAIEMQNDTIIKAKTEVILKVADELEKANSKKEQKK